MDRYNILKKNKFEDEEEKLKDERAKKEHWYYFDHVEKLCRFMYSISLIWIPVQLNPVRMCFRAIDDVRSALIYTEDYNVSRHLLPPYLRTQFDDAKVIVFRETDKFEKESYIK